MRHITLFFMLAFAQSAWALNAENTITLSAANLDNAGTEQQLTSAAQNIWVQSVTIQAAVGNSGDVYIGTTGKTTSTTGHVLDARESITISGKTKPSGGNEQIKLQDIYWDGSTAGDDIVWSYVQ